MEYHLEQLTNKQTNKQTDGRTDATGNKAVMYYYLTARIYKEES